MAQRLKAVMFDLDGVLVEATGDLKLLRPRLLKFLEKKRVRMSDYGLQDTTAVMIAKFERELEEDGKSREMIEAELDDVERFLNSIELEGVEGTKERPGAKRLLSELRDKGIKIGVLTRSCPEYAKRALEKAGLTPLVDAIVMRDRKTKIPPKPNPEAAFALAKLLGVAPDETIMIGDYSIDYDCAKNARIKFIGIASSKNSLENLKESGCKEILSDLDELGKRIGI